jgi:hypothetical protein
MTCDGALASVGDRSKHRAKAGADMLLTIAVVFLVLWLLGLVALPAAGSLIHVLVILAVIALAIHFFSGRRGSITS